MEDPSSVHTVSPHHHLRYSTIQKLQEQAPTVEKTEVDHFKIAAADT
jgi:hypothetical protein